MCNFQEMRKTWCHRIKTEGVFLEVRQMLPESPYLFLEKLKNGKKLILLPWSVGSPPRPPPGLFYFISSLKIESYIYETKWNGMGVTGLRLSPKFYHFFGGFPKWFFFLKRSNNVWKKLNGRRDLPPQYSIPSVNITDQRKFKPEKSTKSEKTRVYIRYVPTVKNRFLTFPPCTHNLNKVWS